MRLAALQLPNGHLTTDPALLDNLTTFLTFTLKHVSAVSPEAFWEIQVRSLSLSMASLKDL
jgi:hypothetical protein